MTIANLAPKNNNALFFVTPIPANSSQSFSSIVSSTSQYTDFSWKGRARVSSQTRATPNVYETIRFWWGYDSATPDNYYQFAIWDGWWEVILNFNGSVTNLGSGTNFGLKIKSWADFDISRSGNSHTVKVNGQTLVTFNDSSITAPTKLAFSGLDCKICVDYVTSPVNDSFDGLSVTSGGAGVTYGSWRVDWLGDVGVGSAGIETLYTYSLSPATLSASTGVPIIQADLSKSLKPNTVSSSSSTGGRNATLSKTFNQSSVSSSSSVKIGSSFVATIVEDDVVATSSNSTISSDFSATIPEDGVTSSVDNRISADSSKTLPAAGVVSTMQFSGVTSDFSVTIPSDVVDSSAQINSRLADFDVTLPEDSSNFVLSLSGLKADLSASLQPSGLTSYIGSPVVASSDPFSNRALFASSNTPSASPHILCVKSTSVFKSFTWKGRARVASQTKSPASTTDSLRFAWSQSQTNPSDRFSFDLRPDGWSMSVTENGSSTVIQSDTNVSAPVKEWVDFEISRSGNTHSVKIGGVVVTSFTNVALQADGFLAFYGTDCRIEIDIVESPSLDSFDLIPIGNGSVGSIYGSWVVESLGSGSGGSTGVIAYPRPSMAPAKLSSTIGYASVADLSKSLSSSTSSSSASIAISTSLTKSMQSSTLSSDSLVNASTGTLNTSMRPSTVNSDASMGDIRGYVQSVLKPVSSALSVVVEIKADSGNALSSATSSGSVQAQIKALIDYTLLPSSTSSSFDATIYTSLNTEMRASTMRSDTTSIVQGSSSKTMVGSAVSSSSSVQLIASMANSLVGARVISRISDPSIPDENVDREFALGEIDFRLDVDNDYTLNSPSVDRVLILEMDE